jgi:hypothetical protein
MTVVAKKWLYHLHSMFVEAGGIRKKKSDGKK